MVHHKKTQQAFDVVVFDIDNVMVDTTSSYTDCIRETVQRYLEKSLKLKPSSASLLTRQDVECFKLFGGFNDDWDTCCGLLLYLLSLPIKTKSVASLKERMDLPGVQKFVRPPLYLRGAEKLFGRNPAVSLRKVARLFQKLYWSKYIRREKLLVSRMTFDKMKRKGIKIAVATGRNRREAFYAYRRFGIMKFIDKTVAVDDLPAKRFKKPDPYALLEIGHAFGMKRHYLYVGDLPDDMRMARLARKKMNVTAWGFSCLNRSRKELETGLRREGARTLIRKTADLNRMLQNLRSKRQMALAPSSPVRIR